MAIGQVETRINLDIEPADRVWEEWEKFKAFRKGNKYALPQIYLNDARRKLIFPDPTAANRRHLDVEVLSEEILQWDFKQRRLRTAVYVAGEFKRGLTFENANPWGQQAEAIAVRSIDLGQPGDELSIKPIVDIPMTLVGDQARTLAADYKMAVWTKNRESRTQIGRGFKDRFGLELVMLGVNGPYFRLAEAR